MESKKEKKTMITEWTWKKKLLLVGCLGALIFCCAGVQTALAQDDGKDPRIAEYREIEAEVKKAVEAGELSEEEAQKRLAAARKKIFSDEKRGDGEKAPKGRAITREQVEKMAEQLRKQVAEGKITEDEMKKRLAAARRMMAQGGKGKTLTRQEYLRLEKQLRKQAAEGKITEEAMKKRLEAARRMIDRSITAEEFKLLAEKFRKMAAEGKMTEAQLKKRLEAARRMIKTNEGRNNRRGVETRGEVRAPRDLEAMKKRLKAAVQAGEMTREEAEKKLEEFKRHMEKSRDPQGKRSEHGEREIRGKRDEGKGREVPPERRKGGR